MLFNIFWAFVSMATALVLVCSVMLVVYAHERKFYQARRGAPPKRSRSNMVQRLFE